MPITTAGINFLAQAALGQGTPFNADNARLGVGNGDGTFTVGQTDLQGDSKIRKAMDVGYPQIVTPAITFKSTFEPEEANFSWNEWGIFNAETGGVMLNRVVESNGTKQNNQTWVLEVTITLSIGN